MDTKRTTRRIRLACQNCSRDDKDFITPKGLEKAIAEGWTDVMEEQSYEDSIDPEHEPLTMWWTHLGYCPDCNKEGEEL